MGHGPEDGENRRLRWSHRSEPLGEDCVGEAGG